MSEDGGGAFGELVGRRVRRADRPSPEVVAITLGGRGGQDVFVASVAPDARGVGLVTERPRGDAADAFARKLRKEIAGAVVSAVETSGSALVLRVVRGDAPRALVVELDGPGNVLLLDEADRVVIALRPRALLDRGLSVRERWTPPAEGRWTPPADTAGLRGAGPDLIVDRAAGEVDRRRRDLDRALKRGLRRLDRRLEAIAQDAARAEEAPRLRADASAILAGLHTIPEGATEATVTDWTAEPPEERTIPLDPTRGAKGTADALFHRARRLDRGVEHAAQRRRETEVERARIEALRERLGAAVSVDEIGEIADQARRLGVRGAVAVGEAPRGASRRERNQAQTRVPYKRFRGHGDRPILVGRGAADNDALTLHVAKPSDLWLHARGQTGAHVIVPLQKGETCPPELLVDAAHLAAHYSDARGEARVEIQHAARRHVRKPKGMAKGAVLVDREKVLTLRVEPNRLHRLLKTEEA